MKKLSRNSAGFGAIELLLIVVVVGLLGFVGWYVYSQKNKNNNQQTATQTTSQQQEETPKEETKKPAPYSFKELGISMDISTGWEVKSNHGQENGANYYRWTVEKAGADGKIELSSTFFQGGFEGCEGSGSLTAATIKEVASTQNSNLMFMSWSYSYDNQTNNRVGIVKSDETSFRTTNNGSITPLKNKDVKSGNYFFCISEPTPGFSLSLNKEQSPASSSRKDRIKALPSTNSGSGYVELSPTAQSYADIKTMLNSIK